MSTRCKSRARVRGIARIHVFAVAIALASSALAGSIPAAPSSGRSYFFATRDACHASGAFSRQDCAAAFDNALAVLRDRAPHFSSLVDCRLRFALCERRNDGLGYSPVGLGVEIVASARGSRVTPAMAVETPASLFPLVPLAEQYAARDMYRDAYSVTEDVDSGAGDILPSNRFEPFRKRPQIKAQFSFNYAALGEIEGAPPPAARETPEQRRARLRAAPFIR